MLGLTGGKVISTSSIPQSTGKIGLGNEVNCLGTESSIFDCPRSTWGDMYKTKKSYYKYRSSYSYSWYSYYRSGGYWTYKYEIFCTHSKDVGVSCDAPPPPAPVAANVQNNPAPGNCSQTEIDLVFVLDASGSVGKSNFEKAKSFVKKVVEELGVSSDAVRVSLVCFSNHATLEFGLTAHRTVASVNAAVDGVSYTQGRTATHTALAKAAEVLNGTDSRSSAVKIVMVITDGKSNSETQTLAAAAALKSAGVSIVGVGVGRGVDTKELKAMSTSEDDTYEAGDFDKLLASVKNITQKTCKAVQNVQMKTCKQIQADVVIVVDSSGSVGSANFRKMQGFINQLIDKADIGKKAFNFGLISFSNSVYDIFSLSKYDSKTAMKNAVNSMRYISGATYTHLGLQNAFNMFSRSTRKNAVKVTLVLTDGLSSNSAAMKAEAKKLRDVADSDIYAIGIGNNIRKSELDEMTGDSDQVYYASDFDKLVAAVEEISKKTCKVIAKAQKIKQDLQTCKGKPADVIYVMDASGSVGSSNFQTMKDAVVSSVKQLDVSPSATHIGIIRFASYANVHLELNRHTDQASVLYDVKRLVYNGGMTYTYKALESAYDMFMRSSRRNAKRLVIVMTDGKSQSSSLTEARAKKLRDQAGAVVFSVGIGSSISQSELKTIASAPEYVLNAANFDKLGSSMKSVTVQACRNISNIANSLPVKKPLPLPSFNVTLNGGQTKFDGRLSVRVNGTWGTVCDYGWYDASAKVVCRQLGFTGGKAIKGSFYPRSGYSVLAYVKCTGTEKNLIDCTYTKYRSYSCNTISVFCGPATKDTCAKP
jgi:collagen type VI alpha